MGGAHLANRPVRVVALCNVAPPPDLYAEAFLVSHHVERDPLGTIFIQELGVHCRVCGRRVKVQQWSERVFLHEYCSEFYATRKVVFPAAD